MILTEQESNLANHLLLQGNLGRRVQQRLQDAMQGASSDARVCVEQLVTPNGKRSKTCQNKIQKT
jgi:hypothetical protein